MVKITGIINAKFHLKVTENLKNFFFRSKFIDPLNYISRTRVKNLRTETSELEEGINVHPGKFEGLR